MLIYVYALCLKQSCYAPLVIFIPNVPLLFVIVAVTHIVMHSGVLEPPTFPPCCAYILILLFSFYKNYHHHTSVTTNKPPCRESHHLMILPRFSTGTISLNLNWMGLNAKNWPSSSFTDGLWVLACGSSNFFHCARITASDALRPIAEASETASGTDGTQMGPQSISSHTILLPTT